MNRDLVSFGVLCFFAVSLAATSKARPPSAYDAGTTSLGAIDAAAEASSTVVAAIPDTSSWKPFTYAPGQITARTPPGATITCTKTGSILTCILMRGAKIIGAFGRGGRSESAIAVDLRAPHPGASTILHDVPGEIIVHRDDPTYGAFCEYAVESPSGLKSAVAHQPADLAKFDAATAKSVLLADGDCLDAIAFAHTLRKSP